MIDIALSSTESEYCGLSMGVGEGYFISMVFTAIGETQNGPLLIGQDNQSCIQIAENPGKHHGRTKHIDVRIRWIERECLAGRLALVYVPTEWMVADLFTKALPYHRHARFTGVCKGKTMPEKEKKERKKRKFESAQTDEMET
jgi:KUP system potassium uptake protein